jgi:hypothetical protein
MKVQGDQHGGRILLGDNTLGGAVIPRPITRQCVGVRISTVRCTYVYIWPCIQNTVTTGAEFDLCPTCWNVTAYAVVTCRGRVGWGGVCLLYSQNVFFPLRRRQGGGFQCSHYHLVPPPGVGGLRRILCLTSLRSVPLTSAKFAFFIGFSLFLLRTPRPLYLLLPFLVSWLDPCTFPCPLPPLLRFFEIRITLFAYCFIRTWDKGWCLYSVFKDRLLRRKYVPRR